MRKKKGELRPFESKMIILTIKAIRWREICFLKRDKIKKIIERRAMSWGVKEAKGEMQKR